MTQKRCYGCMALRPESGACPHCGYDGAPNDVHQLPAGTVLREQYLVGKVLGQGGFGITYLGWDLYLDIPVAIKEYYPSGTVSRDTSVTLEVTSYTGDTGIRFRNNKERFMREAKTLARFSDIPGIVQVKNFFLSNNTAYIVMEFVKGITMKQYLVNRGGRLGIDELVTILEPVMDSLCKVHKAGLVHRDISPDNIMMLPSGQVKLLDFGAVRDVGIDAAVNQELNKSTEAILKQGFAPIEQYQSRGSLGPWTDVYALCATIYYCLTGRVPPDAPERLLGDEDLPLSRLAPELTGEQAAVLRKGMELRAENRFLSMDELHQALLACKSNPSAVRSTFISAPAQTVIQERPVPADVSDKTSIARKKEKKKSGRSFWLVGALIGVFAILVVGVAAWMLSEKPQPSDEKTKATISVNGQTQPQDEQIITGQCGEKLNWSLDTATGALSITGTGRMWDYTGDGDRPWENHLEDIHSLVLGDDVLNVGTYGFCGCTQLTQVRFGEAFEHIGIGAFSRSGLEHVEIPDAVRAIGKDAFSHCESLRRVELPDKLARLEPRTLLGCINLETLYVGADTVIGVDADTGATPFNDHDASGRLEKLVFLCVKGSNADEFAEKYNFDCTYYNEPTNQSRTISGEFGENVTWALNTTTGDLVIAGSGTTWDYSSQELPWGDYARYIRTVTVEDGITRIGHYAFAGCAVESVTIGNDVTSIGEGAFFECLSLKDISFGNSLNSIGIGAFMGSGLERVVLPDSLQIVGESAFAETVSEVTFGKGLIRIDKYAFSACKLTRLVLPDSLAAIGESAFQNCPIEDISFGNGLSRIEKGAFCGCSMEVLSFPDNLKSIGDLAFAKCSALRKVRFGNSLKSIGIGAFSFTAIETADLPQSLTTLGELAFAFCDRLTRVALFDNLTTLEQGTFRECSSLSKITIGANTTVSANPFIAKGEAMTEMDVLFIAKKGGSASLRAFVEDNTSYGIGIVEG